MYLTIHETANYLRVSEKWLDERLAAGDSTLSAHLKLRRDSRDGDPVPPRLDRSRTVLHVDTVARYVLLNTRAHRYAPFPEDVESEALAEKRQEILTWLHWFRSCAAQLPGNVLRKALEDAGVAAETISAVMKKISDHPAVSAAIH